MRPAETDMLPNDDRALRRAWHPVATSVEVGEVPVDTMLAGERYALVRSGPRPREGHGAQSTYDEVRLVAGSPAAVRERYGLVWLAQEPPVADLPEIPEWMDPGYHSAVLSARTRASAGVLTDNFLDVTHFSYLHRQTFGRSRPVTADGYRLTAAEDRVVLVHDTVLQETRRDGRGERRIATYTYHPPYTTHLQMRFPEDGAEAAATLVCRPEGAASTVAYVLVLIPRSDPDLAGQVAFSRRVLEEDLVLVDRMADPRLCLNVRAELHTRADRASVEMRRLLARFRDRCAAMVPA